MQTVSVIQDNKQQQLLGYKHVETALEEFVRDFHRWKQQRRYEMKPIAETDTDSVNNISATDQEVLKFVMKYYIRDRRTRHTAEDRQTGLTAEK